MWNVLSARTSIKVKINNEYNETEISFEKRAWSQKIFYFELHTGPRPRWHPPYQSWPFWCDVPFVPFVRSLWSCLDKRRWKNARIRCTNSFTLASLIATSVKRKSTLGDARTVVWSGSRKNSRQRRCRVSTMSSRNGNGTTTDDELTEPERLASTRHLTTCDVHDGHDYDDDGYDGRVLPHRAESCSRLVRRLPGSPNCVLDARTRREVGIRVRTRY